MGNSDIRWDELWEKLSTSRSIRDFLRNEYGKTTKSEIRHEIDRIIHNMQVEKIPHNLWELENLVIPKLQLKNPKRAELFKLIVKEIRERSKDRFGLPDYKPAELVESEEEEIKIEKSVEEAGGIIGRVALTKVSPASPYRFSFWLKHDSSVHVEPGELICVKLDKQEDVVLAVVDKVESFSDVPDPITHFYSWSFGNPKEEMPTEIPTIRVGEASVIYRVSGSDLSAPFTKSYEIYKSESSHIERAFSELILDRDRVLVGFVKDGYKTLVPVFGDFRILYGYRAGHVNITGKSGVAGKTSYALFLIASTLGYSRKLEDSGDSSRSVSFITFNVKEKDLLSIKNFDYSSVDEAINSLEQRDMKEDAVMWEKAKELGIDPIETFKSAIFYTPGTSGISGKGEIQFSYGLQDLLARGPYVFLALFDPADVDDKMESLVYSIEAEFKDNETSFDSLISKLRNKSSGGRQDRVPIGGIPHHPSTISKFLNRLNKIISATRVLERSKPFGNPIKVSDLYPSDLWVIDIKPLRDNEKRMVFLSVLSDLDPILEARKEGKTSAVIHEETVEICNFPSRVVVFVDELNKFAPVQKSLSPIKSFLVDIASRGRSIGLSLIGAQQFASQIDEEVLGNTSTYLVGKTEQIELANRFYKRIPDGLRSRVPYLKTGEMIMIHEAHNAPFVIRYPRPLHRVEE